MVTSRRKFAKNLKEMHGIKKSTWRACKTFVFGNYVCKFCGDVAAVASLILNSLLSIDNAWSNKNFLYYLTFRMLQHTSSEGNGYNCYNHLKNSTLKRGTSEKIKNNGKIDATVS